MKEDQEIFVHILNQRYNFVLEYFAECPKLEQIKEIIQKLEKNREKMPKSFEFHVFKSICFSLIGEYQKEVFSSVDSVGDPERRFCLS